MALLTFFLVDALASSSNHLSLQEGGSTPTTATTTTGWKVGTTAADNYSAMDSQSESTTFGGSALPSGAIDNTGGDCFRTTNRYVGTFDAGGWLFVFPVIAVTAGGSADGAIRIRVWQGSNPTGAGATEITSAAQQGSAVSNLATDTPQSSTVEATLDEVVLRDEYLFVQVAWRTTGAGGTADDDVLMRVGTAAKITTSEFAYDIVDVGGLASLAAFGTTTLTLSIVGAGLTSAEAFGTASIPVHLGLSSIESEEAFGGVRVAFDSALYGGATEGPTTGGTPFSLSSYALDVSAASDDFSDGTISPSLWSSVVTGSGSTRETNSVPGRGRLLLDTGSTEGSSSSLRSVSTTASIDVSAGFSVVLSEFRSGTATHSYRLALYVDSTTYAHLTCERTRSGAIIRATCVASGVTTVSVARDATSLIDVELRILRLGGRIIMMAASSDVIDTLWSSRPARIELAIENDADRTGRSIIGVSRYVRRPVVAFGAEPVRDIRTTTRHRVDGTAPSRRELGPVDVTLYGVDKSIISSGAFTYVDPVDFRTVGRGSSRALRSIDDVAVRN